VDARVRDLLGLDQALQQRLRPVAVASGFAASRPVRTTDAPARASPAAMARPMPCDEPVTRPASH
jgi:hypothetical protein